MVPKSMICGSLLIRTPINIFYVYGQFKNPRSFVAHQHLMYLHVFPNKIKARYSQSTDRYLVAPAVEYVHDRRSIWLLSLFFNIVNFYRKGFFAQKFAPSPISLCTKTKLTAISHKQNGRYSVDCDVCCRGWLFTLSQSYIWLQI